MTKVNPASPTWRQTAVNERGRELLVGLHPKYLEIRLKGLHSGVTVDYETLLAFARKLEFRRNGGRI